MPDPEDGGVPAAVVVLVTASWCLPCRPAPVLQRELDRRVRRGGGTVLSLLLEDPSETELDAWHIDVLPTWIRFERSQEGSAGPVEQGAEHPAEEGAERPAEEGARSPVEEGSGQVVDGLRPPQGRPSQSETALREAEAPAEADVDTSAAPALPARLGEVAPELLRDPAEDQEIEAPAPARALAGSWIEVRRLTGAAPKHEVHAALYEPQGTA